MTVRVCVTGPECTGKTTLASRLAAHFGTVWVPEYAREYAESVARALTRDDVEPIGRGQCANEDRFLENADSVAQTLLSVPLSSTKAQAGMSVPQKRRLIVFDTDLLSTIVYARFYYDYVPDWIVAEARRRKSDLYLLHDIDVPFVKDAARDAAADREMHLELFRQILEEHGANVVVIRGGWEQRTRTAIEAVERLLTH